MLLDSASTCVNAQTTIADHTGGTTLTANGSDFTGGWEFSVSSPVTVNGLCLWDEGANGLAHSHDAGLWTGMIGGLGFSQSNSRPFHPQGGLQNVCDEEPELPLSEALLIALLRVRFCTIVFVWGLYRF